MAETVKVAVKTLSGEAKGEVELDAAIYDLDPRADILHRMVRYQLAKRQAGTHQTLGRADVKGTTKKFVRQKGSGGARHGNKKVPQFRGGAKAFGPQARSHAIDLPKKVRALALKHALSAKVRAGELTVLDGIDAASGKTKDLKSALEAHGAKSALIIGGAEVDPKLALSSRNLGNVDVLPAHGINVYDVLRREQLMLTREALAAIDARYAAAPVSEQAA